MCWLTDQGWRVYLPLGHSPDVDMVADRGTDLIRVQVKTATYLLNRRYQVAVRTSGGNQSWSGVVKRFGPDRCDYLFVHCGDGRRWFMPAAAVGGGSMINLGGPKYAEYEVARGRPIPVESDVA